MSKRLKLISIFKKLVGLIKSHKIIALILVVLVVSVGYFLRPKNQQTISTQKVNKGDLVQSIFVTGSVESQNSVNLSFQTGGIVTYIGGKEGEQVYRGQAIVSLNRQKLEATFRQAQQDFTAAKAASDQYYDGHKNATESYDEKVKRTALDATQNKAYDQMVKAQKDLDDSTLYSPIDGIITRADVQNTGINITPATVFTITNPDSLSFKMDVDEADIGKIKEGQSVKITLDPYPDKTFNLKVERIDFVTHSTLTGGNAYYVRANLVNDNEDYEYRVGMNGNAEVILGKKSNVLSVPLSSIFEENKVYIKINENYQIRILQTGVENDIQIQVISGIREGEEVVLDPTLIKK